MATKRGRLRQGAAVQPEECPPGCRGGPELLTWAASRSMFLPGEAAGALKALQGEAVQPANACEPRPCRPCRSVATALSGTSPGPRSAHQSRGSTGEAKKNRMRKRRSASLPLPDEAQQASGQRGAWDRIERGRGAIRHFNAGH